ncbi:MAG: DMT family transporter [Tissierellia bacterium]|nr:DMT family transporter [Tissierellia bacterium]
MEKKALYGAILSNIIFGLSFLFAKIALNTGIPPMILLAYRFLIAFIGMVLLLIFGKQKINLKGKPLHILAGIILCQPLGYFIGESYGLLYTTSGFSSIMIALIPIITLGGGALFLKEYPTKKQVFFSLVSIAGVLLLVIEENTGGRVSMKGILFLSMAVLCAMGYNVISRYAGDTFTAFERTFCMFLVGFIFYFTLGFQEAQWDIQELFSYLYPEVIIGVLYLAILSTIVSFFFMNVAFMYIPLAKLAVLGNLVPVISVIAGILILKEPATFQVFLSLILVIGGVIGVEISDRH